MGNMRGGIQQSPYYRLLQLVTIISVSEGTGNECVPQV